MFLKIQILTFLAINLCTRIVAQDLEQNATNIPPEIIEDAALTTIGLIFKYGYQTEVHHVTTQDGYILELHRIPKPGKQPVLLQHGFLDSSATFVMMGPEKGLAYILSDQGYDVWLGNSRGNRYSRKHASKYLSNDTFWKFSWHEMGVYDLPATIDRIIKDTKFSKIHYIGHSQGTTAFFVMCSELPEYNSKILLMQALAPVAYVANVKTPMKRVLTYFLDSITFSSSTLGPYEILPSSKLMAIAGQTACRENTRTQKYCSNLLFLFGGFNEDQMNKTMLPVLYGHIPAGSSVMQLIHYGQLMKSERFCQYDFGRIQNIFKYQSFEPRDYNISRIVSPIILHYSSNDYLSESHDVEKLAQQLPRLVEKRVVPMREFNHYDFIWGTDAKHLLYDYLVVKMKQAGVQDNY